MKIISVVSSPCSSLMRVVLTPSSTPPRKLEIYGRKYNFCLLSTHWRAPSPHLRSHSQHAFYIGRFGGRPERLNLGKGFDIVFHSRIDKIYQILAEVKQVLSFLVRLDSSSHLLKANELLTFRESTQRNWPSTSTSKKINMIARLCDERIIFKHICDDVNSYSSKFTTLVACWTPFLR